MSVALFTRKLETATRKHTASSSRGVVRSNRRSSNAPLIMHDLGRRICSREPYTLRPTSRSAVPDTNKSRKSLLSFNYSAKKWQNLFTKFSLSLAPRAFHRARLYIVKIWQRYLHLYHSQSHQITILPKKITPTTLPEDISIDSHYRKQTETLPCLK